MDLVGRDRRSLKERESYVRKRALLRGARGPIFSLHYAVVRGGTAEGDAIALIVGAHAGERAAAGYPAFEMVDVRGLESRVGGLIVAPIFVQPGNWVGVAAAIRGHRLLAI